MVNINKCINVLVFLFCSFCLDFEGQFSVPLESLCFDGAKKRAYFALMERPGVQEEISGAIELEISISKTKPSKQSNSSLWQPQIFKRLANDKPKKKKKENTEVFGRK